MAPNLMLYNYSFHSLQQQNVTSTCHGSTCGVMVVHALFGRNIVNTHMSRPLTTVGISRVVPVGIRIRWYSNCTEIRFRSALDIPLNYLSNLFSVNSLLHNID